MHSAPPTHAAANRRGIWMMVGAMAGFVVNDAIVKHVSEAMPSAQLIFLRGALASLLVLGMAVLLGAGAQLRHVVHRRVASRALVDACATVMYLLSLFHLPLGNATAINLAAPLFMVVFAVWFLHERPGAARWLAVAVGFAGVLCVVQPAGDGFNAWALLCLAGTLFHATRDLLTRRIDPAIPSIVVTLSTALAVTLLAGALSLFQGWRPFALVHLAWLGAAAVFLVAGYFLIIQCMRQGEVSLTAPFRYSALLFAVLLGYVVWGDVPNAWAWCGIALLLGSGLYVVHDQRGRTARAQRLALDASTD
ncbi:membrane protein [Pseudorhodoferax aquiterrae]|uniref:Membrane protein n=1 Tax=Pseudorhodoferax aquiterrae TaxID=747304 RepID=A0ABQ3FWQ7_9BURK|nr:DMT family transporter [Pseudorhodoferax aquiterrae]GHC71156.1 membrane protein [Pseudorhodoferax aquiterrae]